MFLYLLFLKSIIKDNLIRTLILLYSYKITFNIKAFNKLKLINFKKENILNYLKL
jgi:hypothetical protein